MRERTHTHTGKQNETQRVMIQQLRFRSEQHLPRLSSAAILDFAVCETFVKGIIMYCGDATNTDIDVEGKKELYSTKITCVC